MLSHKVTANNDGAH